MADNGLSLSSTFVAGVVRIVAKKLKGPMFFGFPGFGGGWLDNFCDRNGLGDLKDVRGSEVEEKRARDVMTSIEEDELAVD